MSEEAQLGWGFIQGLFFLVLLIVFFVMTTNIGTIVKLLRAIHKLLQEQSVQQVKEKFDQLKK